MSFGILDQLMRQQVNGQQGPDSVRRVPVNARSSGQQPNIDPRQIMALGGMTQSTAQRPPLNLLRRLHRLKKVYSLRLDLAFRSLPQTLKKWLGWLLALILCV